MGAPGPSGLARTGSGGGRRARRGSPSIVGPLALVGVLVFPLCGVAQERTPGGAASLEMLLARAGAAARAGDVVEMIVCCLPPDERIDVALELVIAAGVAADFLRADLASMLREMERAFAPPPRSPEQQAAIDAANAEVTARVNALGGKFDRLLERHGLPAWVKPGLEPPSDVPEPRIAVRAMIDALDQAALLRDMLAYLDELGLGHRREELRGRLTEIWLHGASVADLQVEGDEATGRVGAAPLRFVRQDGRWYVRRPPRR